MTILVQRSARYLALAALLAATALVSWSTLAALDRVPDDAEAKLRTAERVIAYQAFHDRGPAFRMDGGGGRVKLVSDAVIDAAYDTTRATSYGLRLIVHDGDRVLWSSDVYMQTRESKAGWDGTRWHDEAAWGLDPIEVADERLVVLDLPTVPLDATLTVTVLGQPREVLIRMFRDAPRTVEQRRAAERRLDPAAQAELIKSSAYIPWPMLPADEQDARLSQRWVQISAHGQGGVDFTTRTIFVTRFRAPFAVSAALDGIEVSPDHDAAINVRGPARLSLVQPGATTSSLEVRAVGAASPVGSRVWVARDGSFEIGAAPVTLVFSSRQPEPVRFTLTGPPEALIGASDSHPAPGQLVPDHVRVPLTVTGPGSMPGAIPGRMFATPAVSVSARLHDVPGAPWLGRSLRVDARVVVPTFTDQPQLASMTLRYVARDGRVLGTDHIAVGGAVSRFERLTMGAATTSVTEPTSFRVLAPAGTARVELGAEREIAVRLLRWAQGPEIIEEPYRAVPVIGERWRYARLIERSWFPMLPSNHDELAASGRLAMLDAQVRLEPPGHQMPQPGIADYTAVLPLGAPEQQRAREPVPPDELAAVVSAWPPGTLTALVAGREREIEFSPAVAGRPQLSWVVDPGAVGGMLELTIDGQHTQLHVTSTRGAADLPRVAPGRHHVRVDGPAGSLWIDRAPAGSTQGIVHDRTLYALDLGGLRLRIRQRPGEQVHVYAILYSELASSSTRSTIVMTVDGRHPVRRAGVVERLTVPEVRIAVPPARREVPAALVDLGGRSAGFSRSIGIDMLSDLEPGVHEIDINRIGGFHEEPLWVRFVTTHHRPDAAAPATQWSTREGPRLELIDE